MPETKYSLSIPNSDGIVHLGEYGDVHLETMIVEMFKFIKKEPKALFKLKF